MFPMPRIVYSMASDGLIFKFLAKLTPRFKTPFVASIITGLFSATLATIFDLNELVDMLSIGTLMAYTLVSLCVLVLRYKPEEVNDAKIVDSSSSNLKLIDRIVAFLFGYSDQFILDRCFKPKALKTNTADYKLVNMLTFFVVLHEIGLAAVLSFASSLAAPLAIVFIVYFIIIIITISIIIWRQVQVKNIKTFKYTSNLVLLNFY